MTPFFFKVWVVLCVAKSQTWVSHMWGKCSPIMRVLPSSLYWGHISVSRWKALEQHLPLVSPLFYSFVPYIPLNVTESYVSQTGLQLSHTGAELLDDDAFLLSSLFEHWDNWQVPPYLVNVALRMEIGSFVCTKKALYPLSEAQALFSLYSI